MSMPNDVTPMQLAKQAELWRRLGAARQAAIAADAWVAGRRAAELAVRSTHPQASEALVTWLVRAMFVGEQTAVRLYGRRPEK